MSSFKKVFVLQSFLSFSNTLEDDTYSALVFKQGSLNKMKNYAETRI